MQSRRRPVMQSDTATQRNAKEMLTKLDLSPDDVLLDPMAGIGRNVLPIMHRKSPKPRFTVLLENDEYNYRYLIGLTDDDRYRTIFPVMGDLLDMTNVFRPTAIIMVTSFHGAPKEVIHAFNLLAPGGRMVVTCHERTFQYDVDLFADWLVNVGAEVEKKPAGTYDDMNSPVRLIFIRKP
jgi:hypothetical protein